MIIKVTGVVEMSFYNNYLNQQHQTKYYPPQTTKKEVKQDFGIMLDDEIKKLHFDKII